MTKADPARKVSSVRGLRLFALVGSLLAVIACSGKHGPQVGGESHWLAACSAEKDCGAGLFCACGTCTRACSSDAACQGSTDALCYDTKSPALVQRCDAQTFDGARGLCLANCANDVDCGDGRRCTSGACVPDSTTATATASVSDANAVSDEVSWDTPVAVPKPEFAIAGADDQLIGTWQQPGCGPNTDLPDGLGRCIELVITRAADGTIQGTISFPRILGNVGPFPAAQDPDVGYPVGLNSVQYSAVENGAAQAMPYHMLDGSFGGTQLSFSWSLLELWQDWCALQQPSRVEVGGRAFYYCAPASAREQAGIDASKLALCLPPDYECPENSYACACYAPTNPRFNCVGVCRCDASHCAADLDFAVSRRAESFVLEGDTLVSTTNDARWGPEGYPRLQKVRP